MEGTSQNQKKKTAMEITEFVETIIKQFPQLLLARVT